MKLPEDSKKQMVVFALLLIILVAIVLTIDLLNRKKKNTIPQVKLTNIATSPTPIPKRSEILPSFGKGNLLPTYQPEKGRGVDLENPIVASSIREIQKLNPYLPYMYSFKTLANTEVSLVIPEADSQTNSWTLTINVFGLDYTLQKNDKDYNTMKESFNETVLYVKKWIEERGVDYTKILINWGEQEYIQNKSQEWLLP